MGRFPGVCFGNGGAMVGGAVWVVPLGGLGAGVAVIGNFW